MSEIDPPMFGLWIGDHGLTARVFRRFVALRPRHLRPMHSETRGVHHVVPLGFGWRLIIQR